MANKVQGLVWDVEFPNPTAKLIALKLADNADEDGGSIYPSIGTVAKKTGCSRAAVNKWVRAMEHGGLLKIVKRSLGGSAKDTSERAFDMALLRRLAWPDRRTPSELILQVAEAIQPAARDDGAPLLGDAPKLVKFTVFTTAPRFAQPVHVVDGSDADPSTTWTAPVHHVDGTRPPGGHDPVSQPVLNSLSDERLNKHLTGTDARRGEVEFKPATRKHVEGLGLDWGSLLQRYVERTGKRRHSRPIADPDAYVITMAHEEAARKHKLTVEQIDAMARGGMAERAHALIAAIAIEKRPAAKASPELLATLARGRA